MSIENELSLLRAAITENTAAIREILTAGSCTPTNTTPILTEIAKPVAATKGKAKAAPAPEPKPEAPAEELEKPTKVAAPAPAETEFHDPLDPSTKVIVHGSAPAPKVDPEAVITEITDTWKTMLTAADADRKMMLKDKFPELRAKWGLAEGAKLITLADRPDNLVGLLNDIKAI